MARGVFTPKQACHVQKRHVVKLCAPELVLRVMRLFTLASDFYLKAIQSKKTIKKKKDAKTQGRRVLSPTRISLTPENNHIPGACRGGMRDRQLALLFLKPRNNNNKNCSTENKIEPTLARIISC